MELETHVRGRSLGPRTVLDLCRALPSSSALWHKESKRLSKTKGPFTWGSERGETLFGSGAQSRHRILSYDTRMPEVLP